MQPNVRFRYLAYAIRFEKRMPREKSARRLLKAAYGRKEKGIFTGMENLVAREDAAQPEVRNFRLY